MLRRAPRSSVHDRKSIDQSSNCLQVEAPWIKEALERNSREMRCLPLSRGGLYLHFFKNRVFAKRGYPCLQTRNLIVVNMENTRGYLCLQIRNLIAVNMNFRRNP